mgnify:FL=1
MAKDIPKVSVIIPTYRRPDTLSRAVESVIHQTYKNIEIIVVDDNVPGDEYRIKTEQTMLRYKEYSNIIYVKHPENRNGAVARNTGIKMASGDYIAFLDDDDEFLPDKITNQVSRMEELDESWGACYTNYIKKHNGKIIQRGAEKREGNLKKDVLMKNLYIYAGSNLLVRRAVIEQVKGFDERFRRNQDLEFLVRIMDYYKLAYVDSCSLIIHYDSRITKVSFSDIEKINALFVDSFKSHIDSLSDKEKQQFYLMMDLDKFKYLLLRKEILNAIKYVQKRKIGFAILVKYLYYLFHRKITNKCYGFRLIKDD